MATRLNKPLEAEQSRQQAPKIMRKLVMQIMITSIALVILFMYLMPLAYSFVTSLKTKQQVSDINAPLLPSLPKLFTYEGKEVSVVTVPLKEGMKELALVKKGRQSSTFIDPNDPTLTEIAWEGAWRTLKPVYYRSSTWNNYPKAFRTINF